MQGLGRLSPGQPLDNAISARAWNRAQDAADFVEQHQRDMRTALAVASSAPYTWLVCHNNTGVVIPQWHVLAIKEIVTDPDDANGKGQFDKMPVVRGEAVDDESDTACIAVEPIRPASYGRVALAGIVQARINVSQETHRFASPEVGSQNLKSSDDGVMQIVWKPTGTGLLWSIVRFGGSGGSSAMLLGKTAGAWVKGATHSVHIYSSGELLSEEPASPSQYIVAGNKFADIDSGKWVMLSKATTGHWYVVAAECPS